ncbi:chitobiase/beta-hexosaminidase C-terminal domain-containing protein [Occallatibacter savannae]|uniref:chitobiase/beta-hexosaminidase C-terminal domain-containing protein n=1 Tax=Occallatibacter savannae TaxID=1002691 RepID=UPI000D68FF9A|nr:chitobiase/beta-hexosaminidase C-terminal domain-containing protein [Occallatibacter savannae]
MFSGAKKCAHVRGSVFLAASKAGIDTRAGAKTGGSVQQSTANFLGVAGLLIVVAISGCSAPSSSITSKLSAGITIAAPFNGASVTSPFTVSASAATCGSQPVVSMSYAVDAGQWVSEPASFSAQVAATAGPHVLHVKCLGQNVSSEAEVSVNVATTPTTTAASPQAATPSFSVQSGTFTTAQSVSISSATSGAAIYYTTDGSTPTASSHLYAGPVAVASSMTLKAIAVAQGYGNSAVAQASYDISAPAPTPAPAPTGPSIPSYARSQTEIQLLPNWRIKHDPGTSGTSVGSMILVSDPSLSGQAAKFYTTYTNSGGELYSVTYGNDTDSKNFVYDAEVWISSGSVVSNLEMDNNQVMRNGDTVIYAFQCSGYSNTWEFTTNAGTPTQPQAKWIKSAAPCNPAKWTRDTWHHIQIVTSRDDSGNVTYHSVWFDGVESPINQTVNSDFSLGWALGALVANFQVDGLGTSGSSTLYLDHFTIDRW